MDGDGVDVDLIVKDIPRQDVFVEKPFKIGFTLSVAAPVGFVGKQRVLSVVVQHVQLPMISATSSTSTTTLPPTITESAAKPRVQSFSITSPSTTSTPMSRKTSISMLSSNERTLVGSPTEQNSPLPTVPERFASNNTLPPPVPAPQDEDKYAKSAYIRYLGPSAMFLPSLRLSAPAQPIREPGVGFESAEVAKEGLGTRVEGSWDFELEYLPRRTGFWNVGGLRAVLVSDRYEDSDERETVAGHEGLEERKVVIEGVRVLKEWPVVGEVWVRSQQE